MLEIARFSDDAAPVSLQDISGWTGISRRYLEQLTIPLKAARLLRGRAGRGGGYRLTRAPADVKVGDVLEAATGPLSLVECVDRGGACGGSGACECRLLWVMLTERIRDVLRDYSLADLVDLGDPARPPRRRGASRGHGRKGGDRRGETRRETRSG